MERNMTWYDFKAIVDAFGVGANIKELDETNHYDLFVETNTTMFSCRMQKASPASADQTDYEANYKIVV